jgi:hypothetical protein
MKSKKVKLSDILKTKERTKQKEESDDVTLFLTTNAQHYTSSILFSIRGVLFCLFSIYLQHKHTLPNK